MLALTTALLAAAPVTARASTPAQAVLRVQILTRAGTLDGTCVLFHRESRANDTVLYFLTSAKLMKSTEADLRAGARHIRILRDDGAPIEVEAANLVVPTGDMVDVAIIRVVAPLGTLVPLPLVLEPPSPGSVFIISGFGADGSRVTVPQRVGFEATLAIGGDRDASAIAGCAGAPAIVEGGVFGIVSECAPGRTPWMTPLSVARGFISRHVPGWLAKPFTPTFGVVTRPFSGPLLDVQSGGTRTGELEIPFEIGPRETAVDVTASFMNATSLHLADLTVLSLRDRTVKLRFTMAGVPSAPFSTTCAPGQAHVSVRVNALVLSRPD